MAVYNDASTSPIQPIPSHQISIMDVFFPGFAEISTALQQLLAGNMNSYTHLLCICGLLMFVGGRISRLLRTLGNWVGSYFTTTLHVPSNDEAYDMLSNWTLSRNFADRARSFLITVQRRRLEYALFPPNTSKSPLNAAKSLSFSPWNGSVVFWYKNQPLLFRYWEKENQFSTEENVSVSCLGWSSAILRELFRECREEYLRLIQNKTAMFEYGNRGWQRSTARDVRPLSTVIMSKKEKKELLEDVESFLDPESRQWYSRRRIPYRRGYLLYGPSGTGKSSLSFSIAGCFHLDIYNICLSNISEDDLQQAFKKLPEKCVVLLEDIDAVSAAQSRAKGDVSRKYGMASRGKVSLSVLLNAIDGVASPEGRVLIMTTNYLEKLDSALIRPGRVDKKVQFRLADKDMATELFYIIYKQSEDDVLEKKERSKANETVERLGRDFVAKVPESEFSPAEIMSFLVAHKHSAQMALSNVQEWVDRTRAEKIKATRTESWVPSGFERGSSGEEEDDDDD
ncbi:mitochondrial chaperone BCS1 [Niveomyces insectorum RCEF 264]|uniref:Mitochondrial chaperone BCS1 n=1 Tax=Niveomyces insectorum RCEF 264 TaxID=1081102 RepID=A0A167W2Q3_9HYPO|nr:mitochondrial chaperone BCS1 [Niveomyces insectorum RCEF 264]